MHVFVGKWNRLSVGVELELAQIQWHARTISDNSSAIPESVCAKPCAVGEYYIQVGPRTTELVLMALVVFDITVVH